MKKNILIAFTLFFCSLSISFAQLNVPRPSPLSTVSQKVGLTDVSITYSRPSMKDRKIFGELVPFGKIWRTGANEPTKVSVSDTLKVEGKVLAPGEYALYTIPAESEWTIIFGKNPKAQAGDYKEGDEALRFKVKSEKNCAEVETFTIDFTDVTTSSANIALIWADTKVKFKVESEYDAKVMAQIDQQMNNTMVYYQAAAYYLETNRDLNKALEWVNKATEKNPTFWQLHTKAKIQAKLKDCKGAIVTAQKSLEMAKAAQNDHYIKENEKLIAECKKK